MVSKIFGLLLMGFIGAIVGLAIIQSISTSIGGMTNTYEARNTTVTAGAVGTPVDIAGQTLVGDYVLYNESEDATIDTANATITGGISATDSLLTLQLNTLDEVWEGEGINVSYPYGDSGYLESPANRSVADLILIFAGLGIVIVVLTIVMKSELMRLIGR